MAIYLYLIKFSALRFFVYPIEMLANFLKRIVSTLIYILLWVVISQSGGSVDLKQLVPYYFIAAGMAEINMSYYGILGKKIGRAIKHGDLSSILIKPVNPLSYMLAESIGDNAVRIVMGFVMVIIGLILNSSLKVEQVILFIIFFCLSLFVSFAFNVLEGIVFFYVPEASGFRSSLNHIKNLLGGLMIPLYVFPPLIKDIIIAMPFASLVYFPSVVLSSTLSSTEIVKYLSIAVFWSLIFNLFIFWLWSKSLKRYEAIGI